MPGLDSRGKQAWRRLAILALVGILALLPGCAGKKTDYRILRHSTYTYPYPSPLRLYVAPDRDRSGGEYADVVKRFELEPFSERLSDRLQYSKLKIETYTDAGNPVTVKLNNCYSVVSDSARADIILYPRIDTFEKTDVTVTRDRMMVWYGYGFVQSFADYRKVPRVLVEVDVHLKEVRTGLVFHGFQARGIWVGDSFRRGAYDEAMDR